MSVYDLTQLTGDIHNIIGERVRALTEQRVVVATEENPVTGEPGAGADYNAYHRAVSAVDAATAGNMVPGVVAAWNAVNRVHRESGSDRQGSNAVKAAISALAHVDELDEETLDMVFTPLAGFASWRN